MRKVKQTRFGFPMGNCYAACIASVLDMEIWEIPDITPDHCPNQDLAVIKFLDKLGPAKYTLEYKRAWTPSGPAQIDTSGLAIVCGLSPRESPHGGRMHHVVVALDGEVIWDPHPDGTGIGKPEEWIFILKDGQRIRPQES